GQDGPADHAARPIAFAHAFPVAEFRPLDRLAAAALAIRVAIIRNPRSGADPGASQHHQTRMGTQAGRQLGSGRCRRHGPGAARNGSRSRPFQTRAAPRTWRFMPTYTPAGGVWTMQKAKPKLNKASEAATR